MGSKLLQRIGRGLLCVSMLATCTSAGYGDMGTNSSESTIILLATRVATRYSPSVNRNIFYIIGVIVVIIVVLKVLNVF